MKTRIFSLLIAFMATLQLLAANDFTVDGINYTKLGGDSVEVGTNPNTTGTIIIPETVTNGTKTYRVVGIGNEAFSSYSNITSISMPNSIKYIGSWAFRRCNLSSVTIPHSVITIGNYAFRDCISLISVVMGDSVQTIGEQAFNYCLKLSSISISNSVKRIGNEAFYDCRQLSSIGIPNSVVEVGNNILGNTAITSPVYNDKLFIYLPPTYSGSYNIPAGITTIAGQACKERKELTEIIFPSSLRKINYEAFYGCTNISSIILPEHVDSIKWASFSGCVDLTDVYVNSIEPPYVSFNSNFPSDNSFSSNPTIHLACGIDYDKYQKSDWQYYNLEYPTPNYTLTLSSNEEQGIAYNATPLSCNNDTATLVAQPNEGYHFTSWSDGNTDNPRIITLTQDITLHANFAIGLYAFTATTEDATKGTVSANNGTYQYGTSLTMTATPAENYHFDHWKIEEEVEDSYRIVSRFLVPDSWTNPQAWIWETGENGHWEQLLKKGEWLVYRTNKDNMHILLAMDQSFTGKTEDIDLAESACYTIVDNGVDNPSVNKSFDCVSSEDYEVVKDTITTTIYENPYTLSIAHNTKATAVFTTNQYQYCKLCHNCYIYSEFGTYQGRGNAGCHTVDQGTIITATVLPNEGYAFQQWADGNTDNPRVFTITQDTTMEAICVRDQSVLNLTCSDNEAGRVFGTGTYDKYTSVQIFAIPNSGYDFVGWSDGNNSNPRNLYLEEAEVALIANFEVTSAAQYVVNVTAQDPEQGVATVVSYIRLDAIPAEGCSFVRWSDGNTDNPRYMELNADITLQAIFEGSPSGVDNPLSTPQGNIRKVIIDGNLLIMKDDTMYSTNGQELK